MGNWHAVMKPLSRRYKIMAGDLIGFGKSDQKARMPYFDLNLWMKEAQFLLDRLSKRGPVGVIGHSLSGYLALRLAARNKRIDKVLVTGSLGAKYKAQFVNRMRHLVTAAARQARSLAPGARPTRWNQLR